VVRLHAAVADAQGAGRLTDVQALPGAQKEHLALAFRPADTDSLVAALERLLDLPEAERSTLGAELRSIVARDHEVDALMERLVEEMRPGPPRESAGG